MKIADIPNGMRPREKALREGIPALSDRELLALFLRTGTRGKSVLEVADELLSSFGSLSSLLSADARTLSRVKGVSSAKALALASAVELVARSHRLPAFPTDPRAVAARYQTKSHVLEAECLILATFSRRGDLRSERTIYTGDATGMAASANEIIRYALIDGASSFLLAHNHPSGVAFPSEEDVRWTLALEEEAARLGLRLRDHIILAGDDVFSFAAHKILKG